ncbi:MAG: hypothetical protein AABZ60_02985 [Planctomycetota bacterium]
MKKKLTLLLFLLFLWSYSTPTLVYSQEEPPYPPPEKTCEHHSLERIKNWVPSVYQDLFAQFILFQNLDNVGFNFCTLTEAQARLEVLQKEPEHHSNELQSLTIWVEILQSWVQEEEVHWKETLPKFLPPEEVEKTLKKLEQWKQHCRICIQKLPPHSRETCNVKGLYHRHVPSQKH